MSTRRTIKKAAAANITNENTPVVAPVTPELLNITPNNIPETPDIEAVVAQAESIKAESDEMTLPLPGMIQPTSEVVVATEVKPVDNVFTALKTALTEYITATNKCSEIDQITCLYRVYQAMLRRNSYDDYEYILNFYLKNPGYITSVNSLRGVNSLPKDVRNLVAGINTTFYHLVNYLSNGLKINLSIAALQVTLNRKADTFVTFVSTKMPMNQ